MATDYFLYSGDIPFVDYPEFIDFVEREKKSTNVGLVLSTNGGYAKATYKMGRCLQSRYEDVKIFIPGMCKSAGTILAIAANELIFSPSGELGPVDVQMEKKDSIAEYESGLEMNETFKYLESRSREVFHGLVKEINQNSEGKISFQVSSSLAREIASSIFNPIFSQIDPDMIGKRARAMKIAEEYGIRLDRRFENLRNARYALDFLTWGCPSHDFVIDMNEASLLFKNVRETSRAEENLVRQFRDPSDEIRMEVLTEEFQKIESKEAKNSHRNSKGSQTTTNERKGESRDTA